MASRGRPGNEGVDSCGPPTMLADDSDSGNDKTTDSTSHEDQEEYLDDDFDEEAFSRGRTRSHSLHANDNLFSENIPPAHTASWNPNDLSASQLKSVPDVVEQRSGPLQEREVLALQKGLEEATLPRDEKQLLEEQEEIEALQEEKNKRTIETKISPTLNAPPRKIKILMLGDSGVGKTSLVNRYTKDDFNHTLVGTVGVDFKCKRVDVDGQVINLQVWDTAGQEHFHRITQAYYGGSHAIMLVFDISEQKTLESVSYWMQNIIQHASSSMPIILIGNKKDLRDVPNYSSKCVPPEAGAKAASRATEAARAKGGAQQNNIKYYETSAKTAENVDDAFMSLLRTILHKDSLTAAAANVNDQGRVQTTKEQISGTVFTMSKVKSTTPTPSPSNNNTNANANANSNSKSWFGWMGKKGDGGR
eukprot:gene2539-4950_t